MLDESLDSAAAEILTNGSLFLELLSENSIRAGLPGEVRVSRFDQSSPDFLRYAQRAFALAFVYQLELKEIYDTDSRLFAEKLVANDGFGLRDERIGLVGTLHQPDLMVNFVAPLEFD